MEGSGIPPVDLRTLDKPLLEVGGKPVLDYFIDQIVVLPEIQSIHIVSNDRFFDHFKRWHHVRQIRGTFGSIPVSIHNDGTTDNDNRRGAAGDLQLALNMIGAPSRVLVSGGDNIYCFSLKPLWETFHTSDHHYIVALP